MQYKQHTIDLSNPCQRRAYIFGLSPIEPDEQTGEHAIELTPTSFPYHHVRNSRFGPMVEETIA